MRTNERTALEIYLSELKNSNCQALALEKEHELLKKASNGDKKAIEKIIKANLRFVISVAKKYARNNEELLNDFIQVGNIALYESFESFDYEKFIKKGCNRFISYAGLRITQKIALESKKVYSVNITDGKFKDLKKLKAEMTLVEENLNYFFPNSENVSELDKVKLAAENIGMKEKVAVNLYESSLIASSLDYPTDSDSRTLSDTLFDDKYLSPEDESIYNICSDELKTKLKKLSRLEEDVITLAYGLNGNSPLNYPAIGNEIGYTREGIRIIHNRALEHLKEEFGFIA